MPPRLRKLALTAHLAVSVGWIGGDVAYLVLVGAAWSARDPATVRAAWTGMALVGWYALVPMALGSLATGLVVARYTGWGVFRHYWVVVTLVLTAVATVVLLAHMPTVSAFAAAAARADAPGRTGLAGELLHAGGGLVVLLVVAGLNVFKPRGLTPFGRRRRRESRP